MTIRIPIGTTSTGRPAYIAGRFANRHGLIAGATGTGKTVSLAKLAQGFSDAGTSVFLVDVKGDLAGAATAEAGRIIEPGSEFRVRLDDLGPDLISRALGLSSAQSAMVEIACAYAARNRLRLASVDDLRSVFNFIEWKRDEISRDFGQISLSSIAVVRRAMFKLMSLGMIGDPTYDVAKLLVAGQVTALDATHLVNSPSAYGAALLFILSDLFARLPEVGDLEQPRLVLFLDEAHLLFADSEPALVQRFERIIRLIRSKGVGVYFATQSPGDIPAPILAQLGNRIQHALRGATLADRREIRATAESLPTNPAINAEAAISTLGVGRALVSTIGENGEPQPVEIVKIARPRQSLGARPRVRQPAETPATPQPARPGRRFPRVGLVIAALCLVAAGLALAYVSSPQVRTVVAAAAILATLRSLIPGLHRRH